MADNGLTREDHIALGFERISNQLREMKTEIIKAMSLWREQLLSDRREFDANTRNNTRALHERMDLLERRLDKVEEKLSMRR